MLEVRNMYDYNKTVHTINGAVRSVITSGCDGGQLEVLYQQIENTQHLIERFLRALHDHDIISTTTVLDILGSPWEEAK